MVNWEYWEWKRKHGMPVITRPVRVKRVIAEKQPEAQNNYFYDILDTVVDRIENIELQIEKLKDEIPIPIMTIMERQKDELAEELMKVREDLIIAKSDIINELLREKPAAPEVKIIREQPEIHVLKEQVAPVVIKERHRQLVRLLMNATSLMDYSEISKKLGVAKSSVRVYVSDLQNLGFPFAKRKSEGRVMISVKPESYSFVKDLVEKYGMD